MYSSSIRDVMFLRHHPAVEEHARDRALCGRTGFTFLAVEREEGSNFGFNRPDV